MKKLWMNAHFRKFFVVCHVNAFLAIAPIAAAQAFAAQGAETTLVFSQDDQGHTKIFEESAKALPGSLNGEETDGQARLLGMSDQEKFNEFTRAILDLLKGASGAVCDLVLLPTGVTLSAEVVSATWEQKHLCSKSSQDALGVFSTSAEDTAKLFKPVFRLPKSLHVKTNHTTSFNLAENVSSLGISGQLKIQKEFLTNVAKFFCNLPVRPSEVDVKIPPLKVEWNIDTMCKKDF